MDRTSTRHDGSRTQRVVNDGIEARREGDPAATRIGLFACKPRAGWQCWGNEIPAVTGEEAAG